MSPQRNLGGIDIKMTSQNEKQSSVDDMSSVTASIVSNDHFSTSRASMSLASAHSSNNNGDDIMETSTVGSSNTTQSLRKRKLERVEETILAAASSTRDPKDRWKESTGLTMLSFPLKLHRVLHDYELSCEGNELKNSKEEKKKVKLHMDENTKPIKNSSCNERIIGWVQSGTAFQIYNQERFVEEIMPMYFSQSFREFQKDLALWGFNSRPSVVGPPLRIVHFCSHPLFVKDQPGLCRTMRFGGMVSPKSPSPSTKTSPRWEGNRERFGGIERKENE